MNPVKAYKETQIKTASQGKLIIMLYDESVRQIEKAITGFSEGTQEIDSVNAALIKAQDLITELMVSLDFERGGEIAKGLFSIYLFFNRQLMEANIKKDPEPLKNVTRMLTELRTAWAEVARKVGSNSEMNENKGLNIAG